MSTGLEQSFAPPRQSLRWKVLHSLWLVLPVVGFGCLGASAFIYLGIRMRRKSLWIPGIFYLAVSVAAFVLVDSPDETTTVGDWAVGILMAVWLASIVHALAINPAWLRWKAGESGRRHGGWPPPGYPHGYVAPPAWQPPRGSAGGPPAPAAWQPRDVAGAPVSPTAWQPASDPLAPASPAGWQPQGTAGGPPSPAAWQPLDAAGGPPAPTGQPGPLNVNTASAEQLAALPHVGADRARRAVAERDRRGGFADVSAFADAVALQPHEFARLRPLVVAAPGQSASGGTPPEMGHPGRVLDV